MVKLNSLDYVLYKTHKSVQDACTELFIPYSADTVKVSLCQCTSCGIWLKPLQLIKDLDNLDICKDCYTAYGL